MIKYDATVDAYIAPVSMTSMVKGAPMRTYRRQMKDWIVPNNGPNRKHLLANLMPGQFTPEALEAVKAGVAPAAHSAEMGALPGNLLPHQVRAVTRAWPHNNFALFHGMGSGKSYTILVAFDKWFESGMINEAWVICPNNLIDNWHEQIERWTPHLKGKIHVYGVLSLSAGNLPKQLIERAHSKLAVAVDESQRIKKESATRSKVVHTIGSKCGKRLVATGTSVTKGIEDLYSQYKFLDPNIIGHKSFFTFRNRYCVMGGFERRQIIGYENVRELMELIAPYTDLEEEPVKLPPMYPSDRPVKLSAEQRRLLSELKDEMITTIGETEIVAESALTWYTRGAQIVGGFYPVEGGYARLATNPKLDELVEIIEGTTYKVVVFCRFIAEREMIVERLTKLGITTTEIKAKDPNLQANVNSFQNDPDVRVIVSTYSSGSVGFTLTAGRVLLKYSGTFSFEDEAQSERRIQRIGQEHETQSIRIMANCKIDAAMKSIAEGKLSIAQLVNSGITAATAASILDLE